MPDVFVIHVPNASKKKCYMHPKTDDSYEVKEGRLGAAAWRTREDAEGFNNMHLKGKGVIESHTPTMASALKSLKEDDEKEVQETQNKLATSLARLCKVDEQNTMDLMLKKIKQLEAIRDAEKKHGGVHQ